MVHKVGLGAGIPPFPPYVLDPFAFAARAGFVIVAGRLKL
jgi:hypothetical protein